MQAPERSDSVPQGVDQTDRRIYFSRPGAIVGRGAQRGSCSAQVRHIPKTGNPDRDFETTQRIQRRAIIRCVLNAGPPWFSQAESTCEI